MVRLCQKDNSIVGITAAMPSGTGLKALEKAMPNRYYDVGIAEEHAVLFACGMATMGFHPVCAIYSTFLQRAYDCIVHDVALQDLPVIFAWTAPASPPMTVRRIMGLFDIAYLRCVPNIIAMAPKDEDELVDMMFTATYQKHPALSAIRAARRKAFRSRTSRSCWRLARPKCCKIFLKMATEKSLCFRWATCRKWLETPPGSWP